MNVQYIHASNILKELDLGCFLWNEKLWMGNASLEPIFSECGLVVCTHCTPEFSDEFELKFPELSRVELGHLNFQAETELTLCTSIRSKFLPHRNFHILYFYHD